MQCALLPSNELYACTLAPIRPAMKPEAMPAPVAVLPPVAGGVLAPMSPSIVLSAPPPFTGPLLRISIGVPCRGHACVHAACKHARARMQAHMHAGDAAGGPNVSDESALSTVAVEIADEIRRLTDVTMQAPVLDDVLERFEFEVKELPNTTEDVVKVRMRARAHVHTHARTYARTYALCRSWPKRSARSSARRPNSS